MLGLIATSQARGYTFLIANADSFDDVYCIILGSKELCATGAEAEEAAEPIGSVLWWEEMELG